ncbi:hypothetical protein SNE40_009526 [Patella caerulea]|uniref:Uncharacterized protein n=1 Tax=Patella caerulea TaxID=87958 RepID=A0AAN8JYI5_PATCE
MMLAIQGYDYTVKYVAGSGTEIGLADALSRLPNTSDTADVPLDIRVEFFKFTEDKVADIKTATQADPVLCILKEIIHNG